jgi:hypothetical protein
VHSVVSSGNNSFVENRFFKNKNLTEDIKIKILLGKSTINCK